MINNVFEAWDVGPWHTERDSAKGFCVSHADLPMLCAMGRTEEEAFQALQELFAEKEAQLRRIREELAAHRAELQRQAAPPDKIDD